MFKQGRLKGEIGSLSNHDERDDDDVKYARRDWDENVVLVCKIKLKQRGCSRTTTTEFRRFRFAPYLAWTSLIHLSHDQSFIGDEELVILVALEPKNKIQAFRFPTKLTQNLTLMKTPSQSVSPIYRIHG